jgi:hypothetical protein
MVMCMCCFSDFYKRANEEFLNVVNELPNDYKNEAFDTIEHSFQQGPLAPADNRSAGEKLYNQAEEKLRKTGI